MTSDVFRALTAVSGVGSATATRVAARFGSLAAIVDAGEEGVMAMPGIGERLAVKVVAAADRSRQTRSRQGRVLRPVSSRPHRVPDDLPDGVLGRAARRCGFGSGAVHRLAERWPAAELVLSDPAAVAVHAVVGLRPAAGLVAELGRMVGSSGPSDVQITDPVVEQVRLAELLDPVAARGGSRPVRCCMVCREHVADIGQRYSLCAAHLAPPVQGRAGRHGLARALWGCRCASCLAALADGAAMLEERCAGHALEDIGCAFGLTRERVRQVTDLPAPWSPWEALRSERRMLAAERARVAVVAAAELRDEEGLTCRCCGARLPARRWALCSRRCAAVMAALRRHVDPDAYATHRRAIARAQLSQGLSAVVQRHARAVLEGADGVRDRAVFQKRTLTWAHAVTATKAGWPVADEFHPDAARQLWAWVDVHPDGDPYDHVRRPVSELTDERWLRRVYLDEQLSVREIARIVGCVPGRVRDALTAAGLSREA